MSVCYIFKEDIQLYFQQNPMKHVVLLPGIAFSLPEEACLYRILFRTIHLRGSEEYHKHDEHWPIWANILNTAWHQTFMPSDRFSYPTNRCLRLNLGPDACKESAPILCYRPLAIFAALSFFQEPPVLSLPVF